jgi:hypothetical protein
MQKWFAVVASVFLLAPAAAQSRPDALFERFWDARDPAEAAAATEAIVNGNISFDEALERLKRGRAFAPDAPRGLVRSSHQLGGAAFAYTVQVPDTYDPARQYQVRFQLHGGVGRPEGARRGPASIGSLAGTEQIYVMPSAWDDAPWWHRSQVDSLRIILDRVKRSYNVDENRVVVSGVSDGGTGAYYFAMRDTTPYAAFLPLNGFMMILANPSLQIREQLFPNNLRNKPFFIVNGGLDHLYPTSLVEPYVRHLQRGGVAVSYEPQPNGAHNTAWWPEVRDSFERFAREHPRDPHPAMLTWQVDEADLKVRDGFQAFGPPRAHWLSIDALSVPRAEDPLPDLNEFAAGESSNFGVRAAGMRITSVTKGSNADSFGLLPGDLVLSINARDIPEGVPLLDMLEIYDPGTSLTFRVNRNGASVELAGVFKPEVTANVVPLFRRPRSSGRVDLVRDGNTIRATTRGVAAFTLLISPDVFDLARPITVVVDGRIMFNGRVEKNLATLMKWAARDNDRTMLYAAEIQVASIR